MDYAALLDRLNRAGIRYLVAGGLAVNLHGVPRMTYDVDLIIDFDAGNLRLFRDLLVDLGYAARVPVDLVSLADETLRGRLVNEKNLPAMNFRRDDPLLGEIDILILPPAPFEVLVGRAEHVAVGGVDVPVLSRADLIAMKEAAGRARDLDDAGQLRKIAGEGT